MHQIDTKDRAVGCLIGLAVGDAVGTTLEFQPRDDDAPPLTDMIGGGVFGLKPGEWTDDTAMALALADSLLAHPELNEADLLNRFVSWWKDGTYSCTDECFDIGNTTSAALRNWMDRKEIHSGSSNPRSAGNGSLMRLAPVPIRHWSQPEMRRDIAARQSRTTHAAAEAVDACVLYADIVAEAIAGRAWADIRHPRSESYGGKIGDIAAGAWHSKPLSAIRGTGYVVDCLEAALWCVDTTDNYRSAVLKAANLREDSDTTAAVTGQLAGALYGVSGIPVVWRERLAWTARIESLALVLFDTGDQLRLG